ncbi:hypothetical protein HDU76_012025 [Blyttiomyces sp. JEL0837]|nr:hypothetical protein HDU76_012025 [Blyttiomyces sp. JEL0837]
MLAVKKQINFKESAKVAIERGDFARALTLISKAIDVAPKEIELYDLRASIYVRLNKTDEALQDALKMYSIKPSSSMGYLRAGKVFLSRDMHEAALKVYKLGYKNVSENDSNFQRLEKKGVELAKALGKEFVPKKIRKSSSKAASNKTTVVPEEENEELKPNAFASAYCFPAEIWHEILRLLPLPEICRCMRSSKGLKNFIANSKSLWSKLHLSSSGSRMTDRCAKILLSRGGNAVRELNISDCIKLTKSTLNHLQNIKAPLVSLSLADSRIASDTLSSVIRSLGGTLRSLDISSTYITAEGLALILKTCTRLEELNIQSCPTITDLAFSIANVNNLPISPMPLKRMNAAECSKLTDQAMHLVGTTFMQIQSLDVSKCPLITSKSLQHLANLSDLRRIVLTNANLSAMTFADFEVFAQSCSKLEAFAVNSCPNITDAMMESLSQSCPNLRDLELSVSANVTDRTFVSMAANGITLSRLIMRACPRITDETVIALSTQPHRLEALDISFNGNITDRTMQMLGERFGLLKELNISGCTTISGSGIRNFVTLKSGIDSVNALRVLLMDKCPQVSSEVVREIQATWKQTRVSAKLS